MILLNYTDILTSNDFTLTGRVIIIKTKHRSIVILNLKLLLGGLPEILYKMRHEGGQQSQNFYKCNKNTQNKV